MGIQINKKYDEETDRLIEATGKCYCGQVLDFMYPDSTGAVDCDRCGAIFNRSGQELKPRDQWEDY